MSSPSLLVLPRGPLAPDGPARCAVLRALLLEGAAGGPVGVEGLRAVAAAGAAALAAFGAGAAPPADTALAAAANTGHLTNLAFYDILDGLFVQAPCLCCYRARHAAAAAAADRLLRDYMQYYVRSSYIASTAFLRSVANLVKDLTHADEREIKGFLARLPATPDAVRRLNRAAGLCVAAPLCLPHAFWVYSTPLARRLLRRLARSCQAADALRITVAVVPPAARPRFAFRLYVVGSAAGTAPAAELLRRLELCAAPASPAAAAPKMAPAPATPATGGAGGGGSGNG
jgi:hypothetical protein